MTAKIAKSSSIFINLSVIFCIDCLMTWLCIEQVMAPMSHGELDQGCQYSCMNKGPVIKYREGEDRGESGGGGGLGICTLLKVGSPVFHQQKGDAPKLRQSS